MQVAHVYQTFCEQTIDVVAPLVAAVKPQMAFFEQLGPPGMTVLAQVIQYARQNELLVILDGKRNDIGSTAQAYAEAYLGADSNWQADALTVNPYLGDDSLAPFVNVARQRDAGVFVLVKTSNPGSKLFQDLTLDGKTLFEHVAQHVESTARETRGMCGYGVVGAVVGATYAEQLNQLRSAMPSSWFLVPGFGAQGASAKDVAGAFDQRGLGAVINSSRDITFAYEKPKYAQRFGPSRWQEAIEAATRAMIEQMAVETPAGRLRNG
jgi:orotidine-5'-phosphate decarboxylase